MVGTVLRRLQKGARAMDGEREKTSAANSDRRFDWGRKVGMAGFGAEDNVELGDERGTGMSGWEVKTATARVADLEKT